MKIFKLSNMVKGWFVGDFTPVVYRSKALEVGVKHYSVNDYESKHVHKIATELTVIVSGQVEMNGQIYEAGDIIEISPGEATDFKALTPVTTVVVKFPSVKNDKYLAE